MSFVKSLKVNTKAYFLLFLLVNNLAIYEVFFNESISHKYYSKFIINYYGY